MLYIKLKRLSIIMKLNDKPDIVIIGIILKNTKIAKNMNKK